MGGFVLNSAHPSGEDESIYQPLEWGGGKDGGRQNGGLITREQTEKMTKLTSDLLFAMKS